MVNFNVEDDKKRWIYDHSDVLQRLYTSYDQVLCEIQSFARLSTYLFRY